MATTKKTSNKNAAVKSAKSSNKNAAVKSAKSSNNIPFVFDKEQFEGLRELFNTLYTYKANKVNRLNRVDLFKSIRVERSSAWKELNEKNVKECKLTPYTFVRAEIAAQIDAIKGKLAATPLEIGHAVAIKVSESTSTGISTILLKDYMAIVPGDAKMIKSLAKKKTSDGKLFAVKERRIDGLYITVYRVRVTVEIVDGKEVKNKVATKESNFIQRYSKTETAFKKGLVEGLRSIV